MPVRPVCSILISDLVSAGVVREDARLLLETPILTVLEALCYLRQVRVESVAIESIVRGLQLRGDSVVRR